MSFTHRKPLVGSPTKTVHKKNRIDTEPYTKIGSNLILVASPSVLHFSGYKLHEKHSQKVRIINKSKDSTRVHIVFPQSSCFQGQCSKKGTIAPGMSEEILVTFIPTKYQYYYDSLKIHSECENLFIPIHAYPVLNDINFPRVIDFGSQCLGEKCVRTIPIKCSVPIQFEFYIEVLRAHADFSVEPMDGIIPANGTLTVNVTFQPVKMASASMEIELHVAQFGFKPLRCMISGSCSAQLLSSKSLRSQSQSQSRKPSNKVSNPTDNSNHTDDQSVDSERDVRLDENRERLDGGEKTDQFKALSCVSSMGTMKTYRASTRSLATKTEMGTKEDEISEEIIEGLKIPKYMTGVTASNFVLTQQTGKLKPKDLKVAIAEQRTLRKKQKEEQERFRERVGASTGSLSTTAILAEEAEDSSATTRQLKELAFLQDLAEINEREKSLEFQSQKDHLGERLMEESEIEFIERIRGYNRALSEYKTRDEERKRFVSEPLGMYTTPRKVSVIPVGIDLPYNPTFNAYQNDTFSKRKQVIRHLFQIVSTYLIRRRARTRLECIKKFLNGASSRQQVQDMVETDWKYAQVMQQQSSSTSEDDLESLINTGDCFNMSKKRDTLLHVGFPLYKENEVKTRPVMETKLPRGFQDLALHKLKIPHETHIIGYKEHAMPSVACFVSLEEQRTYRSGAKHEEGVLLPHSLQLKSSHSKMLFGKIEPTTEQLAGIVVPRGAFSVELLNTQSDVTPALTLLAPSSQHRIFVQTPIMVEIDTEYDLRARFWPGWKPSKCREILAESVGTVTIKALRHDTLASLWMECSEMRGSYLPMLLLPTNETTYVSQWDIRNLPKVLAEPLKEDNLSESESDNEEEVTVNFPTFEQARKLFMDENGEENEYEQQGEETVGGNAPSQSFTKTAYNFARYDKMVQLETEYNATRKEVDERLRRRMETIVERIQDPRNQFAIVGHGPEIPSHILDVFSAL